MRKIHKGEVRVCEGCGREYIVGNPEVEDASPVCQECEDDASDWLDNHPEEFALHQRLGRAPEVRS